MEYFIGTLLALAICTMATLVGFDRSRSFYPVVMIVIASYYCLFAVMGGTIAILWLEVAIAILFAAIAIMGFHMGLWLIVAALAGHGAMDLVHHNFVTNAGVPAWWPGFCSMFDITAAVYMAVTLLMQSDRHRRWQTSAILDPVNPC